MPKYSRLIEEPLLLEQEHPSSLKDSDWFKISISVQRCLSEGQHNEELHQLMQSFYYDYIYANPAYAKGLYTKKRFIHDVLEQDVFAKRWVQDEVDLVKMTHQWISSEGHEAEFIELLVQLSKLEYVTLWRIVHQQIYELLSRLEVEGTRKGETDAGEYYCLLHGYSMIMDTDFPPERRQDLLILFMSHWDFLRYVYSVMLRCIVGCRFTNFVQVANNVADKATYEPYLHLFYAPLRERFDDLCKKGTKKEKLEKSIIRLEEKMKQATPSDELDELCELIFPEEFREMLDRHRLKSYQELERELFEKGEEMKNTVDLLNEQAKAMATQLKTLMDNSVPISQIESELLRLPAMGAYNVWLQLNGLLAANEAWKSKAVNIRDRILEKQQLEMQLTMSITAQAGSNVNGVVQQQANYGIDPNRQIPS